MAKSFLAQQADHAERLVTSLGEATQKVDGLSDAIGRANGLALAPASTASPDLVNTGAGGNRPDVLVHNAGGVGEGMFGANAAGGFDPFHPDAGVRGVSGSLKNAAGRDQSEAFIAYDDGTGHVTRRPGGEIIGVVAAGTLHPGHGVYSESGGLVDILGIDGNSLLPLLRGSGGGLTGGGGEASGPSAGIGRLGRPGGPSSGIPTAPPPSTPPGTLGGSNNGPINTSSPDVVAAINKNTEATNRLADAILRGPGLGTLVRSTR